MSRSPYVGKFDDLVGPFLYARGDAVRGYPVLAQSDAARLIATELVRTLRRFDSEAVAYCILPERAHVLAAGLAAGADPHAGIRRWKHVTGLNWYARYGQRLWRERSVVCDIEDVASLDAAAAYLTAAPVRAGLVPRADQYRWLSATRWSVAELARRRPAKAPPWWPERVTSGARSGYSLPR
jgi:hypothetical protein